MVLTPLYLMELTLIHYNVVHYYCFLPVPEGSRLKKKMELQAVVLHWTHRELEVTQHMAKMSRKRMKV